MARETKVRKIGNSYGIILHKEVLEELNVCEGEALYITKNDDDSVQLAKESTSPDKKKSIIEDIIKRYPETLKDLGESRYATETEMLEAAKVCRKQYSETLKALAD